ncbi:MAG: hypothetical protein PHH54_01225 [Candidatus Nanoarchaeia archaeon]|nr:hypothetical protein [Candidatus Nanoarchaeia archaeon]MDD5740584.1 hypothetical protein [Candidatus Nanoarchaeia archaeon]
MKNENIIIYGALAAMALACFWVMVSTKKYAMNLQGKAALNLPQNSNVKQISQPEDYNHDGILDYIVKYKDGKSKIFYGRGYDERDIEGKVEWYEFGTKARILK